MYIYIYITCIYICIYIYMYIYIYIIRYKCCHHCQSPNVYPCLSKDGKWKWCSKAKHGPIWSSDCDASTCWPQIVLNLNWQARCMAQDRNTATWLVYFQTLTKILSQSGCQDSAAGGSSSVKPVHPLLFASQPANWFHVHPTYEQINRSLMKWTFIQEYVWNIHVHANS